MLTRLLCRICGANATHPTYVAREMMFRSRQPFEYFACSDCGCIQIAAIPDDMSRYEAPGYYSYGTPAWRLASPDACAQRLGRSLLAWTPRLSVCRRVSPTKQLIQETYTPSRSLSCMLPRL